MSMENKKTSSFAFFSGTLTTYENPVVFDVQTPSLSLSQKLS